MGRFGFFLYGYFSDIKTNTDSNFKLIPIITLKSRISTIRKMPKGSTISFNCTYELKRDSVISILPIGYADGFPRCLSNNANVKIHNKLCPILGRVCMDMLMVDITDVKEEVKAGDIAIVFDEELIKENAKNAKTIIAELLNKIMTRVNRVYINKGKLSL